jgi:uncharacterized oligopeptide transporter (OPT) family protein
LPTIVGSFRSGFQDLRDSLGDVGSRLRTDLDLPIWITPVGALALALVLTLLPQLAVNLLGAILIIVFGFFFVVVSSRITGEIGVSANPISGMTIAALIGTASIFLVIGWTGVDHRVGALTIAGVIAVAAGNAGATSQDLKTGFWVGGTPRRQQIAILVGALASALVLGPLLLFLNNNGTYYQRVKPTDFPAGFTLTEDKLFRQNNQLQSDHVRHGQFTSDTANYHVWQNTDPKQGQIGKYLINDQGQPVYLVDPAINGVVKEDEHGNKLTRYDAPKATLMSYIIKGVLGQDLPWGLVLIGAMIAVMLEIVGVPSLAFAVGLYLPIATSMPIFVGGVIRKLVDVYLKRKLAQRTLTEEEIIAETDKSHGVLLASGYIAGAAVAGILFAIRIILQQTIGGSWYWGGAMAAFAGPVLFTIAFYLFERRDDTGKSNA